MFNIDKIKEAITNLNESNMVGLWNEYCEANNYYDDYIEYNDIDELLYGCKPSEVLSRIDMRNYNDFDDYCSYDGYGCLYSFNYVDDSDSPLDVEALAQWIYENEDACGYLDEDDLVDCFDAISFVDNEMDEEDVDAFIKDNGIEVDEDIDKYDACKDYLESLGNDTEEIVSALSGLGWLCDIEERVLEYFNQSLLMVLIIYYGFTHYGE